MKKSGFGGIHGDSSAESAFIRRVAIGSVTDEIHTSAYGEVLSHQWRAVVVKVFS